jgi:hypothetical protein
MTEQAGDMCPALSARIVFFGVGVEGGGKNVLVLVPVAFGRPPFISPIILRPNLLSKDDGSIRHHGQMTIPRTNQTQTRWFTALLTDTVPVFPSRTGTGTGGNDLHLEHKCHTDCVQAILKEK